MTIVLPQEVQEALVVAGVDVEQTQNDLVVASGFLEALVHEITHVAASDLAIHVEGIYRRPERLALLDELLEQVIDDGPAPFPSGSQAGHRCRSELEREVVEFNDLSPASDDELLDRILQLADVSGPGVFGQRLHGLGRDA